jgi:hypothetical protein
MSEEYGTFWSILNTGDHKKLDGRKTPTKLQQMGIASVGLGVLLLVSSFAFRYALSQDAFWTDEQAEEYLGVRAEYHNLAFAEGEESSRFQESQAAYESQRNELDRAIAFRDRTPLLLRLAGLVASGIGITMLLMRPGRSG